ncbi:hypothetical protein WA1_08715 [Scytonema hofmannii PCC 7110]|uniref:Filamentous hemagglutinin n=1 Tax=Scytonema hofmannii PCC 7110 TaxID=128403 RepID=A0A139WS23_9CYAN|nr:hypothetical protein [Scytonema hofmannii]KYC35230.1 hypothetical protein WA1_08715 [Scytonema hofmannii PCC 7110]
MKVSGAVDIAGMKNGFVSGIRSSVETGTVGNGGNSSEQGNAGNVTVRASDSIFLAGSAGILSTVSVGGIGKGGNIDINSASLSLQDGAELITSTYGQGDAGNIYINVKDAVTISGTSSERGSLSALFSDTVSNYPTGDVRNVTTENTSHLWKKGDPIIEPQGVYRLSDGKLVMSRECQND